jgi:hypothetical protein
MFELGVKRHWSRNTTDPEGQTTYGPEDPAKLQEVYEKTIELFKTSKLCEQFKKLVVPLFEQKKIKKIIAFGGMCLAFPIDPNDPACKGEGQPMNFALRRMQTQHAALEVMRDIWKEKNPNGGELEIWLQDPQYTEIDAVVAGQHGMKIVNCRRGYQMGWLQLDRYTLVVDWVACFPIAELALEICRPAGILCTQTIVPLREKFWWSCTIKHQSGQEIECPGLGR